MSLWPYATVAADGKLWLPQIVERVESPAGQIIEDFPPRVRREVSVSPESMAFLKRALYGVVFDCKGTAYKARGKGTADTGSKTGNPFEIRLAASGSELKAVLVNRSWSKQGLLHETHLQVSTLELVGAAGSRPKPFDSRMIKKFDTTPYCSLFQTLPHGTKLALGSVNFRKSRDGYEGQWGPFNFVELPAGDYQAQVAWHSERAQCFDESTRQMRKLPSIWRGVVRSNQVTLHLP